MTTTAPGAARPIRRGLGDAIRRVMPRRDDYKDFSRTWKADLVAGLTVGVVALPLALAFGITTGLGAAAGLTTAIVAGLVAAVFGGSNVQVSGPTGAMTVVLVPLVARHGTDAVVVVGILAGILVTVAGVLRLGRVVSYIPWPVIEGFTLGIAVIIFLQQVPAALGVSTPEGENTAAVAVRFGDRAGAELAARSARIARRTRVAPERASEGHELSSGIAMRCPAALGRSGTGTRCGGWPSAERPPRATS